MTYENRKKTCNAALTLGTTFVSFLKLQNLVLKNFASMNSWIHWRNLSYFNAVFKTQRKQNRHQSVNWDRRLLQWLGKPHQHLLI
jgi:hypothetical protein